MRHAFSRLTIPALLLTAAGACHHAGPRLSNSAEGAVRPDSIVVRVANRSVDTLMLALARGNNESRLGSVMPAGEGRFTLATRDVDHAQIALIARSHRESLRTAPFRVQGGQVVWFDIVPGLVGSQVRVRWPEEGAPRGRAQIATRGGGGA